MGLSNSERQARYRQRLKASARGQDLPERISTAIDSGLDVVWRSMDSTDGLRSQFPAPRDYKRWLIDPDNKSLGRGGVVGNLEQLLSAFELRAPESERGAISYMLEILRAVRLGRPDNTDAVKHVFEGARGSESHNASVPPILMVDQARVQAGPPRSERHANLRGLRGLLEAEGYLD